MAELSHVERVMQHQPGPVEVLCREIGARFEPGMETVALFRAFVTVLINEVSEMRGWQLAMVRATGKAPSAASEEAINRAYLMVGQTSRERLIESAGTVHDFCQEANPDDGYPTDHLIDMMASCASAIRFGLDPELPCRSRHAAAALEHIWRLKYGVGLHDSHTSVWKHDWGRCLIQKAFMLLVAQADVMTNALRDLTMLARTSGGTAGRDDELCAACDRAEALLQPLT